MADIFFDKGVWWTWGFIGEEGARVMFPVEIIPKEQASGRVAPQFYAESANEPNVNLGEVYKQAYRDGSAFFAFDVADVSTESGVWVKEMYERYLNDQAKRELKGE